MVSKVDKRKHKTYLSLGTNLGDKKLNLKRAIDFIEQEIGKVLGKSSIYETAPWGNESLHTFYNQVIELETTLVAKEVLSILLAIEKRMGRKRMYGKEYTDRIIDLDVLMYDALQVKSNILQLPHPHLHKRRFVLIPLSELAPELMHPVFQKTTKELLLECTDEGKVKKVDFNKD